jgi:hypothetical protein
MITLKIKKKGFFIEIPGMPPFRTPADVNISHVSIPLVASVLKAQGIERFEIISDTKGKEKVLTQKDFVVDKKKPTSTDYEGRFNILESLMNKLLQKQTSDLPSKKEQITNRLNNIEKLLKNKTKVIHISQEKVNKKDKETYDTFIPEIDLEGLKMKGKASQKTIKQDKSDIDNNADLLSSIVRSDE